MTKTMTNGMTNNCLAANRLKPQAADRSRDRLAPENRRQQILEEALNYMVETGEGDVSLSTLALRLGISRNLVYHYFPNQSVLVSALVEAAFGDTGMHLNMAGEKSGRECIAALIGSYVLRRPLLARTLVLSPKTSCLFRTKIYEKQQIVVKLLLRAFSGEKMPEAAHVKDIDLRPEDAVMESAANAAIEFVRLFVALQAGLRNLDENEVSAYCTGVVIKILEDAARLSPGRPNETAAALLSSANLHA